MLRCSEGCSVWFKGDYGVGYGGYWCVNNDHWYGLVGGWVWIMSWGEGDNKLDRCELVNCGTMIMTSSFIVCNIICWNDVYCWLIFFHHWIISCL